ncbi:MAG: hypothetical protein CMF69_09350 [Magnetovibrio sp.]|nr:hypothetical protein [Magnetovibrio sp.]
MSGLLDYYGFELSAGNRTAAEAYDKGARSFVAWRADAMDYLNAAIAADENFQLPIILKAWILHGGRAARFQPIIEKLLGSLKPAVSGAQAREGALVDALRAAHNGNLQTGAAILEAYLIEQPMDLVAHRLLQFELFWSGESRWMRDVAERAALHWKEQSPDFGHFQAVRAFSNEESGDYTLAEQAGRQAVECEPNSAWGAHAIAHVLLMQGRVNEGIEWLESLCRNWDDANQIKHHCWWHLCLFLLERGEHDRILDLLETQVRNPDSALVRAVPDATIDLQNVAALLMRLELRGVDVGDRWSTIANICSERIDDHSNPFTSAHDAMVLAAVGEFSLIDKLLDNMRVYGSAKDSTVSNTTRGLGIPLVQAVRAHRKGQYAHVFDLIWPIRRGLHQIGGSHAQRDIFYQILVHAAVQSNRRTQLSTLLDDIAGTGFENVDERTLYSDAATLAV